MARAGERMKVLHVITSLMTGGAETMLQKLVGAVTDYGVEATVVSLTSMSRIGHELRESGVPVVALGGKGGILLPHQMLSLLRMYRQARPQIVHTWMYHANVVGHGLLRLGNRRDRPVLITSVRGALHAPERQKPMLRLVRRIDARLSGTADSLVFNSHRAAEQHAAIGYAMRRATVIPNGFDTGRFRPSTEDAWRVRQALGCQDGFLIGLVARFDPLKDQRTFLEAAALVALRVPRCRFILVGRGCDLDNPEIVDLIRQHGLGDKAFALGERHDMPAIQASLDLAVCSSVSESFPNAIGEAMASGVPCVVTDVGDCAMLVGDTGRVVPPRNPEALAQAITQMLAMPADGLASMGARARERINLHFATERVASAYVELYRSCVADREAARTGCEVR